MNTNQAAEHLHNAIKASGLPLEISFGDDCITIYWECLRFDIQPKDFVKTLSLIKAAIKLGARFE